MYQRMMDFLYFLQFACFIFMLINALILGITHLHMKWVNRRYEWSRWLILAGMTGLAIQYLLQMLLGFRAKAMTWELSSISWSIPHASPLSPWAYTTLRRPMPTAER